MNKYDWTLKGDLAGHKGPGSTRTPITFVHATIAPGAQLNIPWEPTYNALVYVLAGSGKVGTEGRPVRTGQTVLFGTGEVGYAVRAIFVRLREEALAERFASKDLDRFEGVACTVGAGGAPLIDGAAATFECFNRSRYEEGDHVIFVGEVERCARREGAQPLIFHGGRYFTELPL